MNAPNSELIVEDSQGPHRRHHLTAHGCFSYGLGAPRRWWLKARKLLSHLIPRSNRDGGIVSPSALAVLRLAAHSNSRPRGSTKTHFLRLIMEPLACALT